MRRALILLAVAFVMLAFAPTAKADSNQITIDSKAQPSPNPATVTIGDTVFWHNTDTKSHDVLLEQGVLTVPAGGDSPEIEIDSDTTYRIDTPANGPFNIRAVAATTTTTTTSTTTTTTSPTSTTSSTTTTTSTTSTSTTTTTTTLPSSAAAAVTPSDSGGGGSSALPLLLGGLVIVTALAAGAFYMWRRSGVPYEYDGPDWTQEPPPTTQGPSI